MCTPKVMLNEVPMRAYGPRVIGKGGYPDPITTHSAGSLWDVGTWEGQSPDPSTTHSTERIGDHL